MNNCYFVTSEVSVYALHLECTDTDTGISIGPIRIRKFVIFKKCQYGYVVGTQSHLEEIRMIDLQRLEKKEEEMSLDGQEK